MTSSADSDPNCVEPACRSKVEMFQHFVRGKKEEIIEGRDAIAKSKVEHTQEHNSAPVDCPLDREELGRATWGLLHTMGVYYPESPSSDLQKKATLFMDALCAMYPCSDCARDFCKEIKASPPNVTSRESLSTWLCQQHNVVNGKLGKPVFDCSFTNLLERWKTGKEACWGDQN